MANDEYNIERPRLPRVTKKHPLVVAVEATQGRGLSLRAIASECLGIRGQSLNDWLEAARADRDWPVPPRRVPYLCAMHPDVEPYQYNPLLWRKGWRL